MACSFEELGYAVTPMLVSPFHAEKCCEAPPICYPCLPRCPKGQIIYCCEKPLQKCSRTSDSNYEDCCNEKPKKLMPPPVTCNEQASCPRHEQYCSPCHDHCKQVKTKYVIPCYRYEDGRIERYVPTRHGRLPMSAYRRNGVQDQIHGYRGAIRYLCAGSENNECLVYTAIEPIRRLYPKVTQEMLPVYPIPSSALKRNGLQDYHFNESGGVGYIRKCWTKAMWADAPFAIPIKPMKKLHVRKLPVSAFKRNGMQDQEHSKLLGTTNFLQRCPRDVSIECDETPVPVKTNDPLKVNQPTILMRRACEVAVGARPRRKPFVTSSYSANAEEEVHRYMSQDERVPYS
ncbi:hypothetical protein KGM_203779 [Danaus plexippus plexippus]|uniref:Uncharacterized protein n=1 Tax=Danaus plexippus plexippus TaxID=278856 RepID=A0A212EKA0_DANPL|nr:hypothetical protein KGM_203779 [Danaus plexippus plexippus]